MTEDTQDPKRGTNWLIVAAVVLLAIPMLAFTVGDGPNALNVLLGLIGLVLLAVGLLRRPT